MHDRGVWPTDTPIDRSEHELADWELLTDALVGVLGHEGLMNVDEMRRGIESMPPDEYEQASYYERWLFSAETILVEKGVLAPGELDSRLGVTFQAGDRVRVAARAHEGHHRTPGYVRAGRGASSVSSEASRTRRRARTATDGLPEQVLYQVCFAQDELWPAARRNARDTTCVDIFEHWLEAE